MAQGEGSPSPSTNLVPKDVRALIDRIRDEQGHLDVLVNDVSE